MALRAGNSKQYNGYVVSWQMPAEVFAPISYRETSSFARARSIHDRVDHWDHENCNNSTCKSIII